MNPYEFSGPVLPPRPNQEAMPTVREILLKTLLPFIFTLASAIVGLISCATLVALFSPVPTSSTPGSNALAGAVVGLLTGLVVSAGLGWFTWRIGGRWLMLAWQLEEQGQIARGTIQAKEIDPELDEGYYVIYHFGEGYQVKQYLSGPTYNQLQVGQTVSVRFLPRDPNLSHLELR